MFLEFDIGATNTRIAISEDLSSLQKVEVVRTNFNFPEAMDEISRVVARLSQGSKIIAAAGGVRALNKNRQTLRNHPRIPLWVDQPLQKTLEQVTGCPVFLENDSIMSALGESYFGAGKAYPDIAYVTISSGIGGAKIDKAAGTVESFEPGAQILTLDNNEPAYLSNLISGTGLERQFGIRSEQINDPIVWDRVARYLSYGLNNLASMLFPSAIILGGGVMKSIPFDAVVDYFQQIYKASDTSPHIKLAELGDHGGLYGSLHYLRQREF